MSPSQFQAKREITTTTTTTTVFRNGNGLSPPSLKINKDSHSIKKSPSSSSSPPPPSLSSSSSSISSSLVNSVAGSNKPPQQRQPVIIYTHSPRVIHTDPKSFMALVQKLTGLSRSQDDGGCNNNPSSQLKQEPGGGITVTSRDKESDRKMVVMARSEDNEASSGITDENNCSSSIGENQVNSCFVGAEPPIMEPPLNPYMTNFAMLPPNSADFMCSSQPFLNYSDSLFFSNNMRASIPNSASLEGIKEFRDY